MEYEQEHRVDVKKIDGATGNQIEVEHSDRDRVTFDHIGANDLLNRLKYIAVIVTAVLAILIFGAWSNHQAILHAERITRVNRDIACTFVTRDHLPDPRHLCVYK